MEKTNYFDYSVPHASELKEYYDTPYRFSQELRDYTYYMFTHPVHNARHHNLFANLAKEWDTNDMLKRAYLIYKWYIDRPQQYGHAMDNVVPHMIVHMWKTFLGMNKYLRGQQYRKYHPASMKMLMLGKGKFLDILISDIKNSKVIMTQDDMIKQREGVDPRGRRHMTQEGSKHFEYLCSLE